MILPHVLALLVSDPTAPPMQFNGLNFRDEVSFAMPGLKDCVGSPVRGSCALELTSFGGVLIVHSIVTLKNKHISAILVFANTSDLNQVVAALQAKYGRHESFDSVPSTTSGERDIIYQWEFQDGFLNVTCKAGSTTFMVGFGSARKGEPVVDF